MEENGLRRETMEKEPLSPIARVFQSPALDACIINIVGFKTKINTEIIVDTLKHNVSKHPRFSSRLGDDGRKWIKTIVNIEDHVVVPNIDLEEIGEEGDGLVDDYVSSLTMIPLDRSKPLWDIHILNVKTSDAEAVAVIRSHHSIGDGMSLMSLLLASTRKISDSEEFPTIPVLTRRVKTSFDLTQKDLFMKFIFIMWNTLRMIWNTFVDVLLTTATVLFLKDTETPLKGRIGLEKRSNLRFYHRVLPMNDIKLIKKAMNMTINDVLLGVTQAALSRYLNCRYGEIDAKVGTSKSDMNYLPNGIRFRACIAVNLRSEIGIQPLADMMAKGSKCRWGNYLSFIFLPFSIGLETNPLVYLWKAKSAMDRKKNSLHPIILYWFTKVFINVLGAKVAGFISKRGYLSISIMISNIVGPVEEVSFQGHPIAYIALSAYGDLPQQLVMHFISYGEKMVISIAVDPMVIPDSHKLLDEMEDSLKTIKSSLSEGGLL